MLLFIRIPIKRVLLFRIAPTFLFIFNSLKDIFHPFSCPRSLKCIPQKQLHCATRRPWESHLSIEINSYSRWIIVVSTVSNNGISNGTNRPKPWRSYRYVVPYHPIFLLLGHEKCKAWEGVESTQRVSNHNNLLAGCKIEIVDCLGNYYGGITCKYTISEVVRNRLHSDALFITHRSHHF